MNIDIPYIAYIIIYIVAGSILSAMIVHIWINRKLLQPHFSFILLLGAWLWLTFQLCEYFADDFTLKSVFNRLEYFGMIVIVPSWIGFVHFQFNLNRMRAVRACIVTGIACIAFIVLVFTNDAHHFLWTKTTLAAGRIHLRNEYTVAYNAFIGYMILIASAGFVYFVANLLAARRYPIKQGVLILAGVALPLSAQVAVFFLPAEYSYMNLTPMCISATSLIILYYSRLRYYRTIPLAQHIVTESMKDLLIILNPEKQIIYINPSAYSLLNLPVERVVGKHIRNLFPQLMSSVERASPIDMRNEEIVLGSMYYDLNVSTIYGWRNRPIGKVLVLRDIMRLKTVEDNLRQIKDELETRVAERTRELANINEVLKAEIVERKKIEEKLQISLSEKDILLGEIHHRVKNNLQVIMSLLKLQKRKISDEKALENFSTAISRIQSIAMIHERLYKSKDLANTEFADYINNLTHEIVYSHSSYGAAICLMVKADNISLDIDRSVLCGLILNELILNAIKYAFPIGFSRAAANMNKLEIDFHQVDDSYVMRICDNGVGLPPGFDESESDSLGMKIVGTLIKQLNGSIEIKSESGTEVSIRFPVKKR